MSGPYGQGAWAYRAAGWAGVIPLPSGAKWPPPTGYTGWAGGDPSGADIQAWIDGPQGAGNIALRLPLGLYGLDVDGYGGKTGDAKLAEMVERLGPLPATWIDSSRVESTSGIRLFRAELPPGRRWTDEPAGHGAGIEAVHFGHRYAVVPYSLHPEGRKYLWRRPDGLLEEGGGLPRPDELPWVPQAWVLVLSEPGEVRTGEQAGHEETITAVNGWPVGEACARVRAAGARGLARTRQARDGAALHPAGRDATQELVSLGHEGHAGARAALAAHYGAFVEVRAVREGAREGARGAAEAEWWRLVRGAVGKLTVPGLTSCDCALRAGEGVNFTYADFSPPPTGVEPAAGADPVSEPLSLADALLARMLSAAQMRDLRPPAHLVEGLLSLDSESWLIARSGSFKTFVALDIAAHVGAGRAWMGRAVTAGEVIYLVAEGAGGMGQRVRAWEQRNGEMLCVRFLPMPVQVKREDHWAALVEACRRVAPRLIVLDTQARITVGLNENDNSEMSEFVEAIGKLRGATGACVLVVHHLGRTGTDARGASAIDGAQDSELKLTLTADRRVVLETDKQRHLPDDVRIELELFDCALDDGGTSLVVGAPLSSVPPLPDWRANLTLNQATLAGVLADIFPTLGATKAELKAEVRKRARRGRAAVLEPMGESSFRKAWDALADAGRLLKVAGSQRYVINNVDVEESE